MKTDITPFDLERALAGEPVVLRDGTKAFIRHHEKELDTAYPLIGYMVRGGTVDTLQWAECGYYFWYREGSEYDIVGMWVEPLVFDHWDLFQDYINYLAKDADGRWFGYSRKPVREYDRWVDPLVLGSMNILLPSLFPDCNWKDSLIKRPEND